MAINYTISYTFSPSTTISSSQVNTNFSDNANTWIGLEALTKSFAKLKIDVDPSTSLEAATKQYVDHYSTWRRPVIQFVSVSTCTVETGSQGSSGSATINFPDGTQRSDSTASHLVFDITRNAALTGTAQSGLRTSLSEATNTWYALYAVKSQVNATDFVIVGDTLLPVQANFSTINSNFGTNSWVYLGMIRNGDNSGATSDILNFIQSGNFTLFKNVCAGSSQSGTGTRLANTGGAASLTYTYASGTGTTQIPSILGNVLYGVATVLDAAAHLIQLANSGPNRLYINQAASATFVDYIFSSSVEGMAILLTLASPNCAMDIYLSGFYDGVLGIGSNPIL